MCKCFVYGFANGASDFLFASFNTYFVVFSGTFCFFFIRIIFWCSNDNKKKEKKSYTLSVEWAGGGN